MKMNFWGKSNISGFVLLAIFLIATLVSVSAEERRTISLNGNWRIAEGSLDEMPTRFYRRITVPGLVDMAVPRFSDVGQKSALREAFWLQKKFKIEGDIPKVALLKIHKAKYGTKVFLNGHSIGESENVLVVGLGAHYSALPRDVHYGHDGEKNKYLPGIFDDVEIILSGSPHVVRAQIVPDIQAKEARVVAWVKNEHEEAKEVVLTVKIREAGSDKIVASYTGKPTTISGDGEHTFDFSLFMPRVSFP